MVVQISEPVGGSYKSKVGKRFGFLTVLSYEGRDNSGKVMYRCQCDCGNFIIKHTGNLRNDSVKRSCGCKMNSEKKLSLFEMEQMVDEKGYKVVESFPSYDSTWTVSCNLHGNFKMRFSSLMKDSKCPNCRTYGFNSTLPTTFYVNVIKKHDQIIAYKYGITNQRLQDRLLQIVRNTNFTIENIFAKEMTGECALSFEKLFKVVFKEPYLRKNDLASGYTETVAPSEITTIQNLLNSI